MSALLPGTSGAWGREGHRVVALIAERELTSETRQKIASLLSRDDRKDLAWASTWADEVLGKLPQTAPWHYVDIPIGETAYLAARDCPNDACVVAQLERLRGILGAPASKPLEQAEALKFLVHLVADVHQPLHAACTTLPPPRNPSRSPSRKSAELAAKQGATCGGHPYSDRGGNEIKVRFGDMGLNLHQVWDTELLYELRGSVPEVAARLVADLTDEQRRQWPLGTPEDWANESHELAQRIAYGMLPQGKRIVLPLRYESAARQAVEMQLQRAGLRLARMLSEALATPVPD